MSLAQKMEVIERVWNSVRTDEAKFESPAWHRELLSDRKRLVDEGKAKFSPWSEAKERIRKKVRASHNS
jgi:putative addiction module component (TIGR02574 family)